MPEPDALLEMTADIVTAMVTNNSVSPEQLPKLIGSVHEALSGLGQAPGIEDDGFRREPAVSVRKSLANPDAIISMIDGKPYKMLTRHIGLHGYTAETYRAAFGLKPDYPMVAPSYAARRSALAKQIGLGRKKAVEAPGEAAMGEPIAAPAVAEASAPKKPRRARKATAALDKSVAP